MKKFATSLFLINFAKENLAGGIIHEGNYVAGWDFGFYPFIIA